MKQQTTSKSRRYLTDLMAEMYREGHTLSEVGEEFGFSKSGVQARLTSIGTPLRRSGSEPVSPAKLAAVRARYEAWDRVEDIAAAYGVSETAVRRWLRMAGANMRASWQHRPEEVA